MFTISALSPPSTPRGPIFSPRQKGCGRWAVYALSLQSPGKRVKLDQQLTFASVFGATTNSTHNSSRLHQFLPQKPSSPSSSVSLSSSTLASRRMKKAPLTPLMVSKSKVLESSGPMTAGLASPMGSTGLSPIVKGLTLGRNGFGGMVGSPLKISSIGNSMGNKISSTMNSTVSNTNTNTNTSINNTMMNSSSTRTGIKTKINDKKPVSTSSNPFPLRKVRKPVPSSLLHLEIDKQEAPAVVAPAAAPTFLASPPPAASAAPPAALAALASPPTENDNVSSKTCSTQPPPMTFRLQKSAPAKKQKSKPALGGKSGGRLAKLSVAAPTGLISPPTVSTPVRRMPPMQLKQSNGGLSRPPPLALGNAANSAMAAAAASPLALGSDSSMSPLSPSMPQTPGASNSGSGMQFAGILGDCSAFGEVSPSFHAQRTPSPAAWAPTFLITPPSPPLPGTRIDSTSGQASDAASASASLAPCTPPWPKSGSSLRKTIFDHIGQPQLSPMDLRGYMAISMNS